MNQSSMGGRVVLVTGGAGEIGGAISKAAAEADARVIVTGTRDVQALDDFAQSLPGSGHCGMRVPVNDTAAVNAMAELIAEEYGRLDVLVNNGATTDLVALDNLDELTDDMIDRVFQVNWRGAFACVRACRGLLETSGDGLIVNIGSNAGLTGVGSNIAYSASKAALHTLTLSLARVLAPKVRVVTLVPGFVDSGFVSTDPAWVERAAKQSLFGTAVPAEAMGNAVVSLVTQFPMTTGAYIPVDGGRL